MMQNAMFIAFTVSELLRENQQGRGGQNTRPTQIMVKAKKILEWEMNGRFETVVGVIVNLFQLISINFSVPFKFINLSN